MIKIVGVDADDTLWDECSYFDAAEDRFVASVEEWTGEETSRQALRDFHATLIDRVGYGPAGYHAAMSQFSDNLLPREHAKRARLLADAIFDELENTSLAAFPGAEVALSALAENFRIVLISKGDEARQVGKLERAGLANYFDDVVIVPEKRDTVYRAAFGAASDPPNAAMIGNSLKSDILPAIAAGAFGLYVPSIRTSPLEEIEHPGPHSRLLEFASFGDAAGWLLNQPSA